MVYAAVINILAMLLQMLNFSCPPTILWHSHGSPHTERPSPHRCGSCDDIAVFVVGMEVVKGQYGLGCSIDDSLESLPCLADRDIDQVLSDDAIACVLGRGGPG